MWRGGPRAVAPSPGGQCPLYPRVQLGVLETTLRRRVSQSLGHCVAVGIRRA